MSSRRQILSLIGAACTAGILSPVAAEVLRSRELSSADVASLFTAFGRTHRMPAELGRWLKDPAQQVIPPYQVFDNVWYVGLRWVAAYALKTEDGVIVIDITHEPFAQHFIRNLETVGIDLKNIRWVLMTHGHFDHVGGAARLKPLAPNARFVMSRRGWEEAFHDARGERGFAMLERPDVTLKDGETVSAGSTVVTLLETPGHTWGTSSYLYNVKDGSKTRRAVTVGGLGLNAISGPEQLDAYMASMKRLASRELAVEVDLTAHPFSIGMTEMIPAIRQHVPGGPHPLADRLAFCRRLQTLAGGAQARKKELFG